VKVLLLGDVFGSPGRRAVRRLVPELRRSRGIDLVVANSENCANGAGITAEAADELLAAGVDLLTAGNHTWHKREIAAYLNREGSRQLRPANYPEGAPGRGWAVIADAQRRPLLVLNLEGRVFMRNLDCPFRAADRLLSEHGHLARCRLVDFHAEATSEKGAMGQYLDGRVSAVLGTHTHVQTADARVLRGGTAFVTDVGMCGPWDSVIGMKKEGAIERFLTQRHAPIEPAQEEIHLQGALVDLDDETGRARSIERVQERMPE
jgi:metallophosphoesterase (TIGR00282 family)